MEFDDQSVRLSADRDALIQIAGLAVEERPDTLKGVAVRHSDDAETGGHDAAEEFREVFFIDFDGP